MRIFAIAIAASLCLFSGISCAVRPVLPPTETPPLAADSFTKKFDKIVPEKLKGNAFDMIGKQFFLITAGNAGSYNSMTGGWGGFGVFYGKPAVTIYVNELRYTNSFLEQNDYFTVSFYQGDEREKLFSVFGAKSGKSTDKEKESGFTPVVTPEGGVAYMEADTVILCKKAARVPLKADYLRPGVKPLEMKDQKHNMYVGEIIGVWVK